MRNDGDSGLFFGIWFGVWYYRGQAVKHHAAEYDRATGRWHWIDRTGSDESE